MGGFDVNMLNSSSRDVDVPSRAVPLEGLEMEELDVIPLLIQLHAVFCVSKKAV